LHFRNKSDPGSRIPDPDKECPVIDRYTKFVLTVIAGALLYLGVIFTPLPTAIAQTPSKYPGQSSGPTEVVVVGWQTGQAIVPVSIGHAVQVTASKPLPITGQVTTEPASDKADRVILVGWEENATREKPIRFRSFDGRTPALPVRVIQ
jgi:hypothetical protein